MKKPLLAAVVILIALGATATELDACGEKFLVMSRGTRFQRAAIARQAANILVYTNPASNLPKALDKALQEDVLRKAGYRPTTVSDPTALDRALRQGKWDIVITDLTDSSSVRGRLQGASAPLLLPVAYNVTGGELAQAKKDHLRVLKGPIKSQAFLDAVDDALALWQKLGNKSVA
jgi:hypothetical protein